MSVIFSMSGMTVPASQRLTVCRVTESLSARSCWVSPRSFRFPAILLPSLFIKNTLLSCFVKVS